MATAQHCLCMCLPMVTEVPHPTVTDSWLSKFSTISGRVWPIPFVPHGHKSGCAGGYLADQGIHVGGQGILKLHCRLQTVQEFLKTDKTCYLFHIKIIIMIIIIIIINQRNPEITQVFLLLLKKIHTCITHYTYHTHTCVHMHAHTHTHTCTHTHTHTYSLSLSLSHQT